eukprot:g27272.t1
MDPEDAALLSARAKVQEFTEPGDDFWTPNLAGPAACPAGPPGPPGPAPTEESTKTEETAPPPRAKRVWELRGRVMPRWAEEDEVSKWRVKYRLNNEKAAEDPDSEWIELELRHFTRELPLSNLPPGVHHFRVAIETPDGWSDWSPPVECEPPPPQFLLMTKRKLDDDDGQSAPAEDPTGRPPLVFHLDATCGRARASTVTLPHGDVLTPVFMPVGTQGTIKGGGEMVSLLKLAVITEAGVEFEDPKSPGSRMLLTPEKSIESQNDIGADIMMALDDVVSSTLDPDCVYPCRTARFGTALVRSGQLRLTSAEFAQDFRPLEVNGKGPLKEYTRAMLHTIVTKEPVAAQLITWHNLWFMLNLLTEMREAIKAQTFSDAPVKHSAAQLTCGGVCGIGLEDLFDWSETAKELPDMPKDSGKSSKAAA